MPYPSIKFRQNPFTSLRVIRRTDRQTDRQTDRTKNITSFFGGGKYSLNQFSRVGLYLSRDVVNLLAIIISPEQVGGLLRICLFVVSFRQILLVRHSDLLTTVQTTLTCRRCGLKVAKFPVTC